MDICVITSETHGHWSICDSLSHIITFRQVQTYTAKDNTQFADCDICRTIDMARHYRINAFDATAIVSL